MNETRKTTASPDGQVVLESLQRAVKQALDKKKRLGKYAVIWQDGKPVMIGDDAPASTESTK